MTKKRVFILGSGFSTQLTGGRFPTSQQLITRLKGDVTHPVLHRNIQDIPEGDQIQHILSRINLDNHVSNEDKKALKQEIFMSFQRQLSLSKLYEDAAILEKAKKLVRDLFRAGDVIINFNWDIVLEHLICLNREEKSTTYLFDWGCVFDGCWASIPSPLKRDTLLAPAEQKVTILKPHGSFNFVPIDSEGNGLRPITDENTHFYGDNYEPKNGFFLGRLWAKQKEGGFKIFPGINENPTEMLVEPNLPNCILPSYVRSVETSEFLEMWKLTDEAIREATEVIVIGYSFPPEDSLTWHLLNVGLKNNKTVRILGDIDTLGSNIMSLRRKIQRLGYVGRDDQETMKQMSEPQLLEHKKWVDFYLPQNGNWDGAYNELIKACNGKSD